MIIKIKFTAHELKTLLCKDEEDYSLYDYVYEVFKNVTIPLNDKHNIIEQGRQVLYRGFDKKRAEKIKNLSPDHKMNVLNIIDVDYKP